MARVELPITYASHAGVTQPAATAGNASEHNFIAENDGLLIIEASNADAAAEHEFEILTTKVDSEFPTEKNVVKLKKSGEGGAIKLVKVGAPQVVNQSSPAGQVFVNPSSAEVKFRVLHP